MIMRLPRRMMLASSLTVSSSLTFSNRHNSDLLTPSGGVWLQITDFQVQSLIALATHCKVASVAVAC